MSPAECQIENQFPVNETENKDLTRGYYIQKRKEKDVSIYRHVQQMSRNERLDASITVIFLSVTITVQKKRESREKTDKSML